MLNQNFHSHNTYTSHFFKTKTKREHAINIRQKNLSLKNFKTKQEHTINLP